MTEGYQYTGCGLDYVYLLNGYTIHETKHGRGVSIKDARRLHEAIARYIIGSSEPLRGREVRFLRSLLQLSQEHLARVLRQKRGSVTRWEKFADRKIPGAADTALRMFYAFKADGHETAKKLVDILQELDEIEHKLHVTKHGITQFEETDQGWFKSAA